MLFTAMIITLTVCSARAFAQVNEDTQVTNSENESRDLQMVKAEEMKYALLAAAIAFGLGAIGAGIAISHVGAAAMGAVADLVVAGAGGLRPGDERRRGHRRLEWQRGRVLAGSVARIHLPHHLHHLPVHRQREPLRGAQQRQLV